MAESDDEEIRMAVDEALAMAGPVDDEEWDDEEDDAQGDGLPT